MLNSVCFLKISTMYFGLGLLLFRLDKVRPQQRLVEMNTLLVQPGFTDFTESGKGAIGPLLFSLALPLSFLGKLGNEATKATGWLADPHRLE